MFKTGYIILAVFVISLSSLQIAHSNDDEFAEFDDFSPSDEDLTTNSPKIASKQSSQSEDSKTSAPFDESSDRTSEDSLRLQEDNSKVEDSSESPSGKKPDLKLVNAPLPFVHKWESYYVEIGFILAFMLYFVNLLVGSSKNSKLATSWYLHTKELLQNQFSLVGGCPIAKDSQKKDDDSESTSTTKKQKGLIKCNESSYTLWCSGRVGMDGLLLELELLKRQDLFSMALNILKPSQDTLLLRFMLNNEGYGNFVFCLANRSNAPRLARDLVDINTFCPKRKPASQYGINSERLFIMSEIRDATTFILDNQTISFFEKYERMINFIHITDQFSTIRSEDVSPAQKLANPRRMATFSFTMPTDKDAMIEMIIFSLDLIDRLRRFKLARDGKQKSEKNRQKISEILQKTALSQRQEAAQLKKGELRRLEKERIYNEDDPAKQKAWEKKEAKRELKKSKMRVKQLKIKSS